MRYIVFLIFAGFTIPFSAFGSDTADPPWRLVRMSGGRDLCILSGSGGVVVLWSAEASCQEAAAKGPDTVSGSRLTFNFAEGRYQAIAYSGRSRQTVDAAKRIQIIDPASHVEAYLQPDQAEPFLAIKYQRNPGRPALLMFSAVELRHEVQDERLFELLYEPRSDDIGRGLVRKYRIHEGELVADQHSFPYIPRSIRTSPCLDLSSTVVTVDAAVSLFSGSTTIDTLPAATRLENHLTGARLLRVEFDLVSFTAADDSPAALLLIHPQTTTPAVCAYLALH